MSTNHRYAAALFDLDGVLADTAGLHFTAWERLAREEGFALDESVHDRLKGVDRMASLAIVLERASRTYTIAEKEHLATRKNGYYQALIAELTPADLLPGAGELLRRLRRWGIPMALASASKNAQAVLSALEIADAFDYVADAAHIRNPKPDPEIFLTAAAGLHMTPGNCLGFEDAPAGVAAIKQAGMDAIGVGDAGLLAQADWIVPDLAHFDAALYFAPRS